MFFDKSWSDWISEYSKSHQHPANQFCHTLGIPLIALSIAVGVAGIFVEYLWIAAIATFVIGWVLQFVGHAIEGTRPEFLRDWRFLFVGIRWWLAKITGRI